MKTFKDYLSDNKVNKEINEEINEAKEIVNKKQLEWFINLANKAKDLNELIDDLKLMKDLVK